MAALSQNYYAGNTPLWTRTSYDLLGRAELIITPDGTQTKSIYAGRATTTIKNFEGTDGPVTARDQESVQVLNAKGDPASVTSYDDQDNPLLLQYRYDGFGNLLETEDSENNVISMGYDIRGNKTSMDDPDMGDWSYVYNALGQLSTQTDAVGNVTTRSYDALGRLETETLNAADPNTATTTREFYYDGTGEYEEFGQLRLEKASDGFRRSFYYDALGRPFLKLSKIEGRWFYEQQAYDAYSRPTRLTHYWRPPGMDSSEFSHHLAWYNYWQESSYNTRGYVTEVTDSKGQTWWHSPEYNAMGQLTSYVDRNVFRTESEYDPETWRLDRTTVTHTQVAETRLDLNYQFDRLGNLVQRSEAVQGLTEDLVYDRLNRLKTSQAGGASLHSFDYDDLGNLTNRTGIGSYAYTGSSPHRVTSAGARRFSYNLNGSITSVSGPEPALFEWNAFNKPRLMETNGERSRFVYDTANQRVSQTRESYNPVSQSWEPQSRKTYSGSLFEQEQVWDASGDWEIGSTRIYIQSPAGVIGSWIDDNVNGSETSTTFYKDHLGSIVAESLGNSSFLSQQMSYDVWGLDRSASDWDSSAAPDRTATDRGYTGHEMLDSIGLIHMNGRIYDPQLGRFLSADPFIAFPDNQQSYNRYSYVLNNPVSLTDPSGFVSVDDEVDQVEGATGSGDSLAEDIESEESVSTADVSDSFDQSTTESSPDPSKATNGHSAPAGGGAPASGNDTDVYELKDFTVVDENPNFANGAATAAMVHLFNHEGGNFGNSSSSEEAIDYGKPVRQEEVAPGLFLGFDKDGDVVGVAAVVTGTETKDFQIMGIKLRVEPNTRVALVVSNEGIGVGANRPIIIVDQVGPSNLRFNSAEFSNSGSILNVDAAVALDPTGISRSVINSYAKGVEVDSGIIQGVRSQFDSLNRWVRNRPENQ